MKKKISLIIDAAVNFFLAVLLLAFSPKLASLFGVPPAELSFYPNILGGVFLGISIALIIEALRKETDDKYIGLGLIGAVCINISGGMILLLWLIFGNLNLPTKGLIFLWSIDIFLLLISFTEIIINLKNRNPQQ